MNGTGNSSHLKASTKSNNKTAEKGRTGNGVVGAANDNNWLMSVLSTQDNDVVEEIDEDVDFVVVDNTQTYTLDDMLSQRTGTQKKRKTKKKSGSESEDTGYSPSISTQKINSEIDNSIMKSCTSRGNGNKKINQLTAKKNGRNQETSTAVTKSKSEDVDNQQKFILSESGKQSETETRNGRKRVTKNMKRSGSESKPKKEIVTKTHKGAKQLLTNKKKKSSKDLSRGDAPLQSPPSDFDMTASIGEENV